MAAESRGSIAVYCEGCKITFLAEKRDLFLGQIYCPCCTHRTREDHRADDLALLTDHFPDSSVYESDYSALSPQNPSAASEIAIIGPCLP